MKNNKAARRKCIRGIKRIPIYLILVLISFIFIFPFILMVTTSIKAPSEVYQLPVKLFPQRVTFQAFVNTFEVIPFFRYLLNTLFLALANVAGVLFSCPLVAYGLSRIKWRGRNTLFAMTLAVMMIPGAVTMVPVYLLYNSIGAIGTYLPLILPSFLGSAFFIFMLRQFFMGLPKSLEEAARVDGCSRIGIYLHIFLPLSRPALATVAVLQLSNVWNDFMGPLIYLSDEKMYTLQIGLQQFKSMFTSNLTSHMAAALMVTVPMVILFFFAQKQFTEGITFSGTKE